MGAWACLSPEKVDWLTSLQRWQRALNGSEHGGEMYIARFFLQEIKTSEKEREGRRHRTDTVCSGSRILCEKVCMWRGRNTGHKKIGLEAETQVTRELLRVIFTRSCSCSNFILGVREPVGSKSFKWMHQLRRRNCLPSVQRWALFFKITQPLSE